MRLTYVLLAALLLVFLTQTVTVQTYQAPPNKLEVTQRQKVSGDGEPIPTFAYMQSKIGQLGPVTTQDQSFQSAKGCPPSHFVFIDNYTLNKQFELNRTFTYIQQKITDIGSITFNSSQTTQYSIFNARPKFFYRDSKQQARIMGNDNILIYNGDLKTDIQFQWSKTTSDSTHNGTGRCEGLSDMITFAKQLVIKNGSFSYQLLDSQNVTWNYGKPFKIRRIVPGDITFQDISVLTRMLNNIIGYSTIKDQLEDKVNAIYTYYLRASLNDEHHNMEHRFDYVWSPGRHRSDVTISMVRTLFSIDIDQQDIKSTFDVRAEGATEWKCPVRPVPPIPFYPRLYGHTQEFVSLDFYENMLLYAIGKGLLDSTLEREVWQSDIFRFLAGDLYEVYPNLHKYNADEVVSGNCKASDIGLKIRRATSYSFNVSMYFDCELNVKEEQFAKFLVYLKLQIQGHPGEHLMNFKLLRHDQSIFFQTCGQYEIKDVPLASEMVRHSLDLLYQANLFGSGFPIIPSSLTDYPQFGTEQNFTYVYDSSHVDSSQADVDDGAELELEEE